MQIVKYLISILIKVGVFVKNNAFNDAELVIFSDLKTKYKTTALTFIRYVNSLCQTVVSVRL